MKENFFKKHHLTKSNDHSFNRYCSECDTYIPYPNDYYRNSLEDFCIAKCAYTFYRWEFRIGKLSEI